MCYRSFSEEFLIGNVIDIHEISESDRPTSVLQAAISLPRNVKLDIARKIFKWTDINDDYVDTVEFAADVVDKVRETDLCDDYDSPVTVYIDPDQDFSLTIYE